VTTAIDPSSNEENARKQGSSSEISKTAGDLDTLELQKDQLSKKIDRLRRESIASIEKLDQDANHVAKKIGDEADAIINYHRSTARKVVETINNEEERVTETVHSLVRSIQFYYWVVVLPLIAFGIVAGYTIKLSAIGMLIFPAVLVAASLSILYILHRKLSALQSKSENLIQLKSTQEEMTEVAMSLPLPRPEVASLQDAAKTLGNSLNELASASSALVLNESRIIESKRKEEFIRGFNFALGRYGFSPYQPEIQESFRKQLDSISDPNSWLAGLLAASKRFFPNVSSSILMLAYFDSIGDKKDLVEGWDAILRTPSWRVLLASLLIRNKLVSGPNVGESSIPVVGDLLANIQSYNLEIVQVEAARLFERLASFKSECARNIGAFFDLGVAMGIEKLADYMPQSATAEKWRAEVIGFIANKFVHVDENYVELLLRDAMGDPGKITYWKSIFKSKNLPGLATILSVKRLPNKHSEFGSATYQRQMLFVMEGSADRFSVSEIEANLQALQNTIVRVGRGIKRASQIYGLQLNDFHYIWEFVPKSFETIESELISITANRLQLKQSVFELFYFYSIGSEKARELFKSIVASETESKALSDYIASSTKFVPKNPFFNNQNVIIPLLRTQDSFDLTSFAFHYTQYERLWSKAEALFSYMRQKKVSERTGSLNFTEILKTCPAVGSTAFEDQMVRIATTLFIEKVGKYELSIVQKEELALAATCVFLFESGDPAYKALCQKIAIKPLASKTLYRYIHQSNQEFLSFPRSSKLDQAIIEAIEFQLGDPNFDYFNLQLAGGKFPPRMSDLVAWKLNELKAELKKLARNGFDKRALDNYLAPVRRELDKAIDQERVRILLSEQTLTAYTLTPSFSSKKDHHPLTSLLDSEDDYMTKSAHDLRLRKDEERYDGLVKLIVDKSGILGIVPLDMSFESFGAKFEEVLQGAVKMYNAKFQTDQLPDPLPCYLTRIFPSDNALKEIGPTQGESEPGKPIEVLRNVISNSLTASEGLALLALLLPVAQVKLALRNVMESIVDRAHLYMIFADIVPIAIGQNKELLAKLEARAFDNALLGSYNATRLSQLGKIIADQAKLGGEDGAKRKFYATMRTVLPEIALLSPRKKDMLLRTLFRRISGVGSLYSTR
jgi:hypothetical protein